MCDKNAQLNKWKAQHCNEEYIILIDGVCHSREHMEVIFGTGMTCDGCPYNEKKTQNLAMAFTTTGGIRII